MLKALDKALRMADANYDIYGVKKRWEKEVGDLYNNGKLSVEERHNEMEKKLSKYLEEIDNEFNKFSSDYQKTRNGMQELGRKYQQALFREAQMRKKLGW